MKTEITTLPNKLKIVTCEMPGARSVSVSILVAAGGRTEDFDTQGGASHFLEHILFKGTKNWPTAQQISGDIDAVGGLNNAYTSNDMTSFYIKLPKAHLGLALDILADMIMNPLFDAEEIDRERGVIIEEINWRRHDDPMQFVEVLLPPLLWPDDPLKQDVGGKDEVIRSIERQTIIDYKETFYQPGNMVVSVAGGAKHEEVVAQVKGLMGGLKAKAVPKIVPVRDRLSKDRTAIYTKPTAQAHFLIGSRAYPYLHKDDPACGVLTTILGQGMSSRLFLNVRERKGLAYSVNASRHNYVDTGIFEVYAGANIEKTDEAIMAVLEELERIRLEPVPADELQKAKNKIRGGLQMSLESNGNVADRFGTQLLLLGKIRDVDETIELVDAVTADDVQRVAADILAPKKLRMAIIASDGSSAKLKFEELIG
ncbi:MAG TPA: pitrilysin family protein [Candidatus Saccharimonadales bacterium]|nr:pitrilysin family protein [Candidatus Saccharimonadales bacterium]